MSSRETRLFLKSLQEDGIDAVLVNRRAAAALPAANAAESPAMDQLKALREKTLKCTLCSELADTRKSVVFGSGSIRARLMFVGEAPGRDEDLQGLPFVGAAGQLLTKIIESIGLTREQVFIANVLKCRPPQNRQPKPDEILNCEPYLRGQIDLIKPQIICALGTFAAQTLLKRGDSISKMRGQFFEFAPGIKILCTYHPAYLLRNPADKKLVWEDMKRIRRELAEPGAA